MITISESESDFSHTRLWGYGNQENVSNDVHPSTQKKATTNTHIAPWRPHFATFGSNLGRHAKLASISTSNIAPSRPYHIIVAAPACRPTQPAFVLAPAPPRLPKAAPRGPPLRRPAYLGQLGTLRNRIKNLFHCTPCAR